MADDITLKLDGLNKLLKTLKNKLPVIKVGILGNSASRDGQGPNNATIGAWHEFGSMKVPQRSFLRVPIAEHLQPELEKSGAFTKDVIAQVVKSGSLVPWVKIIAVAAEGVVADAFDTGGFGVWKPSNMTRKKVAMTLVETQQLRNSITSEVQE